MIAPEVAAALAARRRKLGLSFAVLGQRVGVRPEMISKWERRAADPGLGNLVAWAEELGFDGIQLGPERGADRGR